MAEQNPFELEQQQQLKQVQPQVQPQWSGMAELTPQGQGGLGEGYFQQVDPAVMQMMWAPPQPQPLPQVQPLPLPQVNPLV